MNPTYHNKRLYLVQVKIKNDIPLYLGSLNEMLTAVPLGLYIKREYPQASDQAYTYDSFSDAHEAEKIIRKALSNKKNPKVFMKFAFADLQTIKACGEFVEVISEARGKYDNSIQLTFDNDEEEELVGGFGFDIKA
jgi:hypothetical protein